MRDFFATHGRPQAMRFDNGGPWASPKDLPTPLCLWLVGLGIVGRFNRPYRPTENPKVERCHGLIDAWGEPAQCADFAQFREKMAWVVELQGARYPLADGRTRRETFPELASQERPYRAEEEASCFDMERVSRYLAARQWPRLASKVGQIYLYGKAYSLGHAHKGEWVWVRFDAATQEWVVFDRKGAAVKRWPAEQITAARIRTLNIAHPRPPSKKRQNRHNLASPKPT
jgi:hypothetical protein